MDDKDAEPRLKPLKRARKWMEDKVVSVRLNADLINAIVEITEDEGINMTEFLTRAAIAEVERVEARGPLGRI